MSVVNTWLVRIVLAAAGVLLVLMCLLVWRISTVLSAISGDVWKVTATAARVSEKVDRLDQRLEKLQAEMPERIEEAESLLDAALALREKSGTPRTEAAEQEIEHLLSLIDSSRLEFGHSDETYPGSSLYLKLFAKKKAYGRSIASAEDFIERVATRTLGGHEYHVTEGGEKRPLAVWLREALERYRVKEAE